MRTLFVIIILIYGVVGAKVSKEAEIYRTAKKANKTETIDQEQTPKFRYGFYRSIALGPHLESRRVFEGESIGVEEFPTIAALMSRTWTIKCSGSIISAFWVLTAGHCVSFDIVYIKYNTPRPMSDDGDVSPVLYVYRHPNYKVEKENNDVIFLQHDLGLIRGRDPFIVKSRIPPISDMDKYKMSDLMSKEIKIIGYGAIEKSNKPVADHLFAVKLKLRPCERSSWYDCFCGVTAAGHGGYGICAGDSGGPVVYNKTQIGITSMGPLDCTNTTTPGDNATSVFTAVLNYVFLINSVRSGGDVKYEAYSAASVDSVERKRVERSDRSVVSKGCTLRVNLCIAMIFLKGVVTNGWHYG